MVSLLLVAALFAPSPASSIDKAMLQRVIRAHLPQIRRCYQKGLQRDPRLAGKVVVRFTIDGSGRVHDPVVTDDSTLTDEAVSHCVAKSFLPMRFPEFPGERGLIHVTYPFRFAPDS